MAPAATSHAFEVPDAGRVSALLVLPDAPTALYAFAHGAGAGMRHAFMEDLARRLAGARVATFRYQFPYTEAGSRRPDSKAKLIATVRAAIDAAQALAPDLPLFAGGKSMGGRMTSEALADEADDRVRGVVFVGFPLHPAKKPGTKRAEHLARVANPMLFLNGTRDTLADLDLLTPIVDHLPRATLHVIDGADHGFAVLKRSGRTPDDVMNELTTTIANWCAQQT